MATISLLRIDAVGAIAALMRLAEQILNAISFKISEQIFHN